MQENNDPQNTSITQSSDNFTTIQASLTLHEGLLPSPETVSQYELVLPGAFDRILTMAEKEQQNSFEHNRKILDITSMELVVRGRGEFSKILFAHCGQIFGFVTVIVFFSLLAYSMWLENMTMFGTLFGAGAFAGLAQLVRSFQNKSNGSGSH
jgi:uncharacterized membrane protein